MADKTRSSRITSYKNAGQGGTSVSLILRHLCSRIKISFSKKKCSFVFCHSVLLFLGTFYVLTQFPTYYIDCISWEYVNFCFKYPLLQM